MNLTCVERMSRLQGAATPLPDLKRQKQASSVVVLITVQTKEKYEHNSSSGLALQSIQSPKRQPRKESETSGAKNRVAPGRPGRLRLPL